MSLNLEEFIDAAKRLYKSVSLPEKSILVKRNRSNSAKKGPQPATFKPSINANSRKMVEHSRNGSMDRGSQRESQNEHS